MAEKSIKKNYAYNASYSVLMVLTPLVTAPYLSRVLHANGVGISSYVSSVISYFGLIANLGAWTFARREISYYRDDIEKRSQIFWDMWCMRFINASLSFVVCVGTVLMFAKSYRTIFLIYSIGLISAIFDITWLLSGLEEFGKIFYRNVAIKILDIVYIFIFVKTQDDLPLYVFGAVFFGLLGNLSLWRYLPSYVRRPDFKAIRPYRYIRGSLALFLPTIAVQVYTMLDKTMLGWFTEGGFENGYYEQSMKISKIVLALITSLAGVMIPRIAYLYGKQDREQINFYMYRSYNFVWCLGAALCFGLIGISDNFVPWFFGAGYDKVAGLLKISSLLIIIIGFSNATGIQYLIPTQRHNFYTYSVMAGAAVNFSLNIFLIRMYQSYGAMIASVIAEFTVAAFELYIVRREISIARIIMSGRNNIIAGGIMLAVLVFMGRGLSPSILHTFMMILTGAAVYMVSLLVMRDKFFLEYSAKPINFVRGRIERLRGRDR